MSPMVRRSLTNEHALLGFLKQGPLHGYQLHRQLCDPLGLGRVWRIKQAQLYALLDKLEGDGYITSSLQLQETHPARRVYQLTASGQRALHEWLSTPVQAPRQMRQEFHLKLYFAQRESQELWAQLIAVQRTACQRWLESHQSLAMEEGKTHSYAWLVDQYRTGQIQAMLAWLDLCGPLPS
jgi:PadR family transcriptional regulator, regulatory protein AphA